MRHIATPKYVIEQIVVLCAGLKNNYPTFLPTDCSLPHGLRDTRSINSRTAKSYVMVVFSSTCPSPPLNSNHKVCLSDFRRMSATTMFYRLHSLSWRTPTTATNKLKPLGHVLQSCNICFYLIFDLCKRGVRQFVNFKLFCPNYLLSPFEPRLL